LTKYQEPVDGTCLHTLLSRYGQENFGFFVDIGTIVGSRVPALLSGHTGPSIQGGGKVKRGSRPAAKDMQVSTWTGFFQSQLAVALPHRFSGHACRRTWHRSTQCLRWGRDMPAESRRNVPSGLPADGRREQSRPSVGLAVAKRGAMRRRRPCQPHGNVIIRSNFPLFIHSPTGVTPRGPSDVNRILQSAGEFQSRRDNQIAAEARRTLRERRRLSCSRRSARAIQSSRRLRIRKGLYPLWDDNVTKHGSVVTAVPFPNHNLVPRSFRA